MSKQRLDEEGMNALVCSIYHENNFQEDDLLCLALMCLVHWGGSKDIGGRVGRIQKQLHNLLKEREGGGGERG